MKRRFLAIVVVISVLLIALLPGFTASANVAVTVQIDGETVVFADQNPIVIEGRTFVPVRGVFERMGFDVSWDPAARQVRMSGDSEIIITIGSNVFTTDGVSYILDAPAITIGGRTMLPLHMLIESVGYRLSWDAGASTVRIISGQAVPPAQEAISFDPGSLMINVRDLNAAMLAGTENLIVIGIINPASEQVEGSAASRAIDGAYLLWRPDYSSGGSEAAISPAVTGMRRSVAHMEELLSRSGAAADSQIVVYSADAMHDAARFVWQLRMLGHERAWYIDGGINAWYAAGFPTGNGIRLAQQPIISQYRAPNYDPTDYDATIYDVINALENPDEWVVLDTRSLAEYNGERTGASTGAFGTGRIAGSVHIDWTDAVDPDTRQIRPVAELEELYLDAINGRRVITYCQSGVRSAHTWMVLVDVLGLENVWNYEGSWIEWSYAASEFSDYPGQRVLELTEEWYDNNGEI